MKGPAGTSHFFFKRNKTPTTTQMNHLANSLPIQTYNYIYHAYKHRVQLFYNKIIELPVNPMNANEREEQHYNFLVATMQASMDIWYDSLFFQHHSQAFDFSNTTQKTLMDRLRLRFASLVARLNHRISLQSLNDIFTNELAYADTLLASVQSLLPHQTIHVSQ